MPVEESVDEREEYIPPNRRQQPRKQAERQEEIERLRESERIRAMEREARELQRRREEEYTESEHEFRQKKQQQQHRQEEEEEEENDNELVSEAELQRYRKIIADEEAKKERKRQKVQQQSQVKKTLTRDQKVSHSPNVLNNASFGAVLESVKESIAPVQFYYERFQLHAAADVIQKQLNDIPLVVAYPSVATVWFSIGIFMLLLLRHKEKRSVDRSPITISTILFCAPCLVLLILKFTVANAVMTNVALMAFTIGIIFSIYVTPQIGSRNICLHVSERNSGAQKVIWINSAEEKVKDVRLIIKEAFNVRGDLLHIEGGRGKFIDDTTFGDQAFIPLLVTPSKSPESDLTGHISFSCVISIEKPKVEGIKIDKKPSTSFIRRSIYEGMNQVAAGVALSVNSAMAIPNTAMAMMTTKSDLKYESVDECTLGVRLTRNLMPLNYTIKSCCGFAGAAKDATDKNITMLRWTNATGAETVVSEDPSLSGGHLHIDWRAKDSPIRDGDEILLRSNNKYMSVAKGWWISWANEAPRRSGVFTVEIVEKAQKGTISEQFSAIKGKISKATGGGGKVSVTGKNLGASENDRDFLGIGDLFRLKSAKFPDYELGVTGVKIVAKKEVYYLGLRKVSRAEGQEENPGDAKQNEWSQSGLFVFK